MFLTSRGYSNHGNVSPALTGRFALLIFFPLASDEKEMGTSTGRSSSSSISSMSDIVRVAFVGGVDECG